MREHIGHYRIEAELGRGGMGVVYRGVHEHLGREVAIKALTPELTRQPEFKDRFFAEARTQARLQHPHLVAVYDLLAEAGEYFIVMELVTGIGLDDLLRGRAGRLELAEALGIFSQMLSALDYAHSEGVIHRDIKPSNVLITADGRAKLTDFGIALLVGDKRLTASQSTIGTPTYMSPEQILRPRSLDHRTDIYSAAVVFFEMLTGSPPFDGETEYGIKKLHVEAAPPDLARLRADLPPGIAEAVALALRKNPDDRPPSAGAFLRALLAASPEEAAPAVATLSPRPVPGLGAPTAVSGGPRPAARPAFGRFLAENRRLLLGAAGLLAATLGAALVLMRPTDQSTVPALAALHSDPAPSQPPAPALQPPPAEPIAAPPAPRPAPTPVKPRSTPRPRTAEPVPAQEAPAAPPQVAETQAEPSAPAPVPAESGAALDARLDELSPVADRLEDLSKKTWRAYERARLQTALGPGLASFRDATAALRKELRAVRGTGIFGALRRRGRETDTRTLESRASDVLRRGGDVESLLTDDPGRAEIESSWREVRRELQRLETFFLR